MTLAVFNPWHDMALANGTPHYQPPRSAMTMADDLAHLAHLWEEEGRVTVWGWDALVVHQLCKQGVPRDMLPRDEALQHIRRLSSRQTAVRALATMSDTFKSYWCTSESEVKRVVAEHHDALLKSPWSCSGKGLMRTSQNWEGWMRNVISKQGGIVVEPFYDNKQHDFALEYEVRDHRTHYLGLSVFDTAGGTYSGNILDTEESKLRRLGIASLQELIAMHTAFLDREVAPFYSGPLGIDLMLMRDGSIHPCVEINLRRTMGWVALQLERTTPLPATFVVSAGSHYEAEIMHNA